MIQTGINLKNIVEFLKEHLSVLIVIPAFIGGLWQAIELMNISYSYIRFFSLSQIVPDGILIIMLIICVIFYNIIGWFADILFIEKGKEKPIKHSEPKEYEKHRKSSLIQSITLFILGYSYIYLMIYFMDIDDYLNFESRLISLFFFIYIINTNLDSCYYYAIEKHKKYFKACNILLIVMYVSATIYICENLHKIFIIPLNNANIERVKKDFSIQFPKTKQELLYFNDKYIFIKVTNKMIKDKKGKILKKPSEKIHIIKLESIFDDSLKN